MKNTPTSISHIQPATQNLIKYKVTGRVDIPWRIFEKNAKISISGPKKLHFFADFSKTSLGYCDLNFEFFYIFLKNAPSISTLQLNLS